MAFVSLKIKSVMLDILTEYIPGFVVFTFFISLLLLVIHLTIWGWTIHKLGWWNSSTSMATKKVRNLSFATAIPLSMMATAAPQADSDLVWVIVMWLGIGLLVALTRTQESGIANQEGIV